MQTFPPRYSDSQVVKIIEQRDEALNLAELNGKKVAKLQNGLNAERDAHLKTIAQLRDAPVKIQHTGIDPDVVSNLATALACGEQRVQDVAAGLLDEIERAKSWVTPHVAAIDTSKREESISHNVTGEGGLQTPKLKPVDLTALNAQPPVTPQKRFSSLTWEKQREMDRNDKSLFKRIQDLPVPAWDIKDGGGSSPKFIDKKAHDVDDPIKTCKPQATSSVSTKKSEEEWCAAHPMSRLKALEGVMDIALARIAELEKHLGARQTASIVPSSLGLHVDDGW